MTLARLPLRRWVSRVHPMRGLEGWRQIAVLQRPYTVKPTNVIPRTTRAIHGRSRNVQDDRFIYWWQELAAKTTRVEDAIPLARKLSEVGLRRPMFKRTQGLRAQR